MQHQVSGHLYHIFIKGKTIHLFVHKLSISQQINLYKWNW
jgi:hypothetical protein